MDPNDGDAPTTAQLAEATAKADAAVVATQTAQKELADYKAAGGRDAKAEATAAVDAYKAEQEAANLTEQGKYKELNEANTAKITDLEGKLTTATESLTTANKFIDGAKTAAQTENDAALAEMEKNNPDKKEAIETFKKTLSDDPFAQKTQLTAMLDVFGTGTVKKKDSPKAPLNGGGEDGGLNETLEKIKTENASGGFNPFGDKK